MASGNRVGMAWSVPGWAAPLRTRMGCRAGGSDCGPLACDGRGGCLTAIPIWRVNLGWSGSLSRAWQLRWYPHGQQRGTSKRLGTVRRVEGRGAWCQG